MSQKTARREQTLAISSPAFSGDQSIPRRHTCDGEDVSPALAIQDVPETAKTLALVMDDPDAPGGMFNHWLVWNLPASHREIPENVEVAALGGTLGRNDFGVTEYRGPARRGGAPTATISGSGRSPRTWSSPKAPTASGSKPPCRANRSQAP